MGKHVYKKGSVTLEGPDPHRIARKMSDPDIHHVPVGSPASLVLSGSIHSTSLSIPIGSPSVSSIRHC